MDAKEFIRTHKRMCKKYGDACKDCLLLDKGCYSTSTSIILPEELDENVVDLVEKWAEENPVKTNQDVLLELFPNSTLITNGTFGICPKSLDKDHVYLQRYVGCSDIKECDCLGCKNQFWNGEYDQHSKT